MGLPTHYYEKIIEKLGGNPAKLPDRCECTMVDEIIHLIDSGLEGGGGGFVVNGTCDAMVGAVENIDKTFAEICEAAAKGPVMLIATDNNMTTKQFQCIHANANWGEAVFACMMIGYNDNNTNYENGWHIVKIDSSGTIANSFNYAST